MKFEDILEKNHYKSIITLTRIFETLERDLFRNEYPNDSIEDVPDGLCQVHYRYALVKNHDNMDGYFKRKMGKFFNNSLESLYENKSIIKCITNRNNLTNFLTKLVKQKILEKNKKFNPPTYKISKKYYPDVTKWLMKKSIDSWAPDSVVYMRISDLSEKDLLETKELVENEYIDITNEEEQLILEGTLIEGGYFGFDFEKSCNNEEKRKIIECLFEIKKNIAILTKLKYDKTNCTEGIALFAESYIDKE